MGKSSKDKRDAYYRLAKEQGWRARSAFKLIQLDEQFDLFRGVRRVVDLCAAPGSWSQVLSRVLIRGEPFGRRAWERKQADLMHNYGVAAAGATTAATGDGDGDGNGDDPVGAEKKTHAATLAEDEQTISPRPDGDAQETQADAQTAAETTTATTTPATDVRIVAVDLQPMSPLEGITSLVGDITHPATIPRILAALDPETYDASTGLGTSSPVDLVVSDGAPDVTGLHDLDVYVQAQLLFAALGLAARVLRPGGAFVAKIFRARDVDLIYAQLRCLFAHVHCAKPRSSRASSLEAFVVCRGFRLPRGYDVGGGAGPMARLSGTALENALAAERERAAREGVEAKGPFVNGQRRVVREDGVVELEFEDEEAEDNRWIAPFVACGDLSAFDSDATYHLPKDRVVLDPVQPPTAPPYKRALEIRRQQGGFYGKTGKKGGSGN